MDTSLQMKLMYLMERLDQPLYMGPRGSQQNVFFKVEQKMMNKYKKTTADTVEDEVMNFAKRMNRQVTTVNIPMPTSIPDLSNIRAVCPRKAPFSFFNQEHAEALFDLYQLFLRAPSVEEFLAIAAYCRDSEMMNPRLFLYAYTKACLTRPDTRGFKFPALFEVMPDVFVNTVVIRQAEEISGMPMEARKVLTANGPAMMAQAMSNPDAMMNPDMNAVEDTPRRNGSTEPAVKIDRSYTGRDFNPENKLAYFREDMGVNSHHHHWHVIYHPKSKQDRRGELFYYMHHNLIARYDAERLCNGLSRVKLLDITCRPIVEEGYFSKLTAENSKQAYAGRQANTQITDIYIQPDPDAAMPRINRVNIEDMRKHKDRILEAIDTGFAIKTANCASGKSEITQQPLFEDRQSINDKGIEILGNMVESNEQSVSQAFYGRLHVDGHIVLANLHDPLGHFKETFGAVGDLPTAMRDPAFYRWHKFIDEIFEHYKQHLCPYTREQLVWDAVEVKSVIVQTKGPRSPEPNVLRTYWMQSDIDLGRGLDIRRTLEREGPIWARVTHLNHDNFQYKINVENKSGGPVRGTFRVFMAPRDNEHGQRLYYVQQRVLFFEMDKFVLTLKPGVQEVLRESTDSSISIPWEQSFKALEEKMERSNSLAGGAICGCGWPQHMLLPRGTSDGMYFDLFVMVTNAEEDIPEGVEINPNPECKESLSFCGVLNKKYPDSKPMGFPFDRNPLNNRGIMMTSIPDHLKDYLIPNSNMNAVEISIVHQPNVVKIRGGGATPGTPVLPPELATSRNTRNNNQVWEGRDTLNYGDDDYY